MTMWWLRPPEEDAMRERMTHAVRRVRGYALAFIAGAAAGAGLLLSSHAIPLGISAMNLGERIALAGGAQSGLVTREEVEVIAAETMARYARREAKPATVKVAAKR